MRTQLDHPRHFSPAMRALNKRQQLFVISVLELGSTNYSRATRMAGYEGDVDTIKVTAHRLSHDPKIILALNEESKRRLQASAPMAISELIKIAENSLDEKTKLKAVDMILNRTGHHALSEHRVDVQHTYSDPDAILRIQALSKQLGLDPVKLLGTAGVKLDDAGQVIDGEFVEVEDDQATLDEPDDDQTGDGFTFIPDPP